MYMLWAQNDFVSIQFFLKKPLVLCDPAFNIVLNCACKWIEFHLTITIHSFNPYY